MLNVKKGGKKNLTGKSLIGILLNSSDKASEMLEYHILALTTAGRHDSINARSILLFLQVTFNRLYEMFIKQENLLGQVFPALVTARKTVLEQSRSTQKKKMPPTPLPEE